MATVRNLAVEITANASKLRSEVASSQRTIQNFSRTAVQRLGSVAKVLTGLGVAAAGAFTAFGVMGVRKINQVAAKIDELVKSAGNLRFEVGDLQELRFIAGQTGTSIGELERGVQFMNRTIAQGSDKTADALRGIGFSIDQVMAMSPAERFRAITTAIGEMGSEVDQTRILYELFGRSGANMLNLVSADQEKLAQVVKDSGVLLTQEQARAVEAYQDAKGRLGSLFEGFKMQMTANLAPAMTKIVEFVERFATDFGGMDKIANRVAVGIIDGISSIISAISSLIESIEDIQFAWNTMIGTGQVAGSMISRSVQSVSGAVGIEPVRRRAEMMGDAFDSAAMGTAESRVELDRRRFEREQRLNVLDELSDSIRESITPINSLEESADKASDALDKWDRMVLDRLNESNDQASVKVDLNLTTDRGQLKGEIIASPELARAMQTIAAREINNTARGVAA